MGDGLRLGFVIPWHDLGDWVWEYLPPPHSGRLLRAAPQHRADGPGTTRIPPYAAELAHLIRRRARLRDFDVVFTWELRTAVATALLRRLQRADATRLVAVGPILKGATARSSKAIGWLLGDASAIVCFSTAECAEYATQLDLPATRFRFWPTPWRSDEPICADDDGFALALGRSNRDIPTLFSALADSAIPLTVVVGSPADFRGASPPAHARCLFDTGFAQTNALVRTARVHAIPLFPVGYSSGQTVLLRAMAVGKTCVVSDVAGVRDYVRADETAVLVPPGDPAELRAALERAWSDPALRARIGRAAAETVRDEFGLPRFAQRVLALAREVTGR